MTDLDLLTGSGYSLMYSFYQPSLSLAYKTFLVITGVLLGILCARFFTRSAQERREYYFFLIVFYLFTLETAFFFKLHKIDVDFTVAFSIAPYIFLMCYTLPLSNQWKDTESAIYLQRCGYFVLILQGIFLMYLLFFCYIHDSCAYSVEHTIYPSSPWLLLSTCMYYTWEYDWKGVGIICFLYVLDASTTCIHTILWDNYSPLFCIIQGWGSMAVMLMYSVRIQRELMEIYQERYSTMLLALHGVVIALSIQYFEYVHVLTGYLCILFLLCKFNKVVYG